MMLCAMAVMALPLCKRRKLDQHGASRSKETFGLRNLGNTCYMNAVMQAYISLREFRGDLAAMPLALPAVAEGESFRCTVDILRKECSAEQLSRLLELVASASPAFRGNEQQDAHEFFLEYTNRLHDELLVARNRWLEERSSTELGN
eukprot:CAMPEP_0176110106 /NCGR_PEP_ID=MMETSP0120_2-20121206/55287_1 /TAXON_ID=160619 /ORGANISM="Kryptoperidinium foliaceum, Strain CCMP 1326" /LENGTH=146 /DNA_ID=CAMNT_0017444307 /DNA_START=1 /DNA_END=438 /DNA_ORIENTATION=+